jgi:hypothetical protein
MVDESSALSSSSPKCCAVASVSDRTEQVRPPNQLRLFSPVALGVLGVPRVALGGSRNVLVVEV